MVEFKLLYILYIHNFDNLFVRGVIGLTDIFL